MIRQRTPLVESAVALEKLARETASDLNAHPPSLPHREFTSYKIRVVVVTGKTGDHVKGQSAHLRWQTVPRPEDVEAAV
jgi:hypothetical protein